MATYATPVTSRARPLYRGTQAVWYVLGAIEALLAFRFLLKLFGANPSAGFTDFIYTLSFPFVAPFEAVFSETQVAGSVFEWTTLLAMLVYYLVALAVIRLLVGSKPVSRTEATYKLEHQA
jgi:uncharacterized protein YggT (Ycf19 family)